MRPLPALAWLLLTLPGCGNSSSHVPVSRSDPSSGESAPVKTGAAVLAESGFERFQDKAVGLIINPTSRVDTARVVDLMYRAGIEISALFGPEHGVRGTAEAGATVRASAIP